MNKMLIMAIVVIIQFIISMTTTPSLIKISKPESDLTMGQSWPIALVQMLLMIIGFVLLSYLGTGTEKVSPTDN